MVVRTLRRVTRSLSMLLLAAAVATGAAFGVADVPEQAVAAGEDGTGTTAPVPTAVEPITAPTSPPPARLAVPDRDLAVAAAPAPSSAPVEVEAPVTFEGPRRQLRGTGDLVAATGESQDAVASNGRTVRFSVEVEAATGLDPDAVTAVVEEALYDPRSWAATHDLRRVAPDEADLHVIVASPSSVDALCARAGLNTAGWLSCWSGDIAAINVDRWTDGVGHVDDLDLYRRYVVNHEVGHGLGYGHVGCPGRGMVAPVMQQQTKSLEGCVANEWAFP